MQRKSQILGHETRFLVMTALGCGVLAAPSMAVDATDTAFETGAIHDTGDDGNADYYGSGNDDNFGEYGIASFNFEASDFGGSLIDITSVTYSLTFNDRSFSDGSSFELFYSADDFDASYTGLTYDDSGTNDPGGVDPTQFTSLESLGSYTLGFDPTDGTTNGGNQFDYTLNLTAAAKTSLIDQINSGSDFQLILAAENVADDITFSGTGNTFDPGDPELTINGTIPEPGSLALLGLGGLALLGRRRK